MDTWALGVSLFRLHTGNPPWTAACAQDNCFILYANDSEFYFNFLQVKMKFKISAGFFDFFKQCCAIDPEDRISLDKIKDLEWTKEN